MSSAENLKEGEICTLARVDLALTNFTASMDGSVALACQNIYALIVFFTIFLKVAVPTNMPIQTIKNRFLFYVESIFHLSFCKKKNHYSAKTITHRKKKEKK